MIIDFHTHAFPAQIAERAVNKLSLASHVRPFTDGTEEGLSAAAREAGVDLSVIVPVATNTRQVPSVNDSAARINEHTQQTHLLSFGCIHPDYPLWREELARIAAMGFKGVKLHPTYQGADFDDPRYLRILERAAELGLIVLTHAGLDIGFPGEDRCSPKMVLNALRQVGPVKLVLAHMGGWRQWDQVEELLADAPVWLDTSFSAGMLSPLDDGYYAPEDLPLLDQASFLRMVRVFGTDRLLFGTDSPWSGQRESLAWIRALDLTQAQKDAILGGNAMKLLGLD